jgi:hypothetical protein
MPDIHGTREELVALIAEQGAEIERLRAALKPFAKMADQLDEWQKGTGAFEGSFDANDLRRAREVLK